MNLSNERRPRVKLWTHVVIFCLVAAILGVSIVRLMNTSGPAAAQGGRSNTISLSMGAKTLVILFYQLMTEHKKSWKRWGSLKANLILNVIECAAWGMVGGLTAQALTKICSGVSCLLGWVVVLIAVFLCGFSIFATYLSWLDLRARRRQRKGIPEDLTRLNPLKIDSRTGGWNNQSRAPTPTGHYPPATTYWQPSNNHGPPVATYSHLADNRRAPNTYDPSLNQYNPPRQSPNDLTREPSPYDLRRTPYP
ncbi:hypothetical protein CC80DRAFT_493288 [Byssothecium circinans]|uniref:MARVEL domain-containing protein n=1 Tax=Byssothecium circinans TaxID=147558 RepID=A0A6A5TXI4_9PLEO|nr:hypothetical protein CC80DRAFT_493288 [Byssothecium circinans]